MNSRPLLDYLTFPEDFAEPAPAPAVHERMMDPLEARLKDLEARLRANEPAARARTQDSASDLTLSAQIEAILKRKAALQPPVARSAPPADLADHAVRPARIYVDAPPTVPAANDTASVDQDFLKFSEAVYLMGQAAKRFIEQPQTQPQAQPVAQPAPQPMAYAPSTHDIDALSAVLRETVSAFRSVADDLAVSAGEIRNHATREERQPARRRPQPARYHDDDEIIELRESIADLQDRLDDLLQARRRRY